MSFDNDSPTLSHKAVSRKSKMKRRTSIRRKSYLLFLLFKRYLILFNIKLTDIEPEIDTNVEPNEIINDIRILYNFIEDHNEIIDKFPSEFAYIYRPFEFDKNSDDSLGRFKIRDPNEFIKESLYKKRDTNSDIHGVMLLCGKLVHDKDIEATLAILFSKDIFTEISAYEWWERNKERFISEYKQTLPDAEDLIKSILNIIIYRRSSITIY